MSDRNLEGISELYKSHTFLGKKRVWLDSKRGSLLPCEKQEEQDPHSFVLGSLPCRAAKKSGVLPSREYYDK